METDEGKDREGEVTIGRLLSNTFIKTPISWVTHKPAYSVHIRPQTALECELFLFTQLLSGTT